MLVTNEIVELTETMGAMALATSEAEPLEVVPTEPIEEREDEAVVKEETRPEMRGVSVSSDADPLETKESSIAKRVRRCKSTDC